jgi:hypothetical protein
MHLLVFIFSYNMINAKIKITIDSNLINLKQRSEAMNKLEELHLKGEIQIVGAERLYEEMKKYKPEAFDKASSYENIGEPWVIGHSAVGRAYISSGDTQLPTFNELTKILFPNLKTEALNENEVNDVMHLLAHAHSDAEYFITDNTKDFIHGKKNNQNREDNLSNLTREELGKRLIKVLTAEEAVERFCN